MLPTYHFREYLTNNYIDENRKNLGYTDNKIFEHFIMDFEILYHLLKEIPDLVVKGGMSVPFHIPDRSLKRLSIDIDVVTPLSKEKVESAMEKVKQSTSGLFTIPSPYFPENPERKLPLLAYSVPYTSVIDGRSDRIKVEIFYDFNYKLPLKSIDPGAELIGFKLDYPLRVFDLNTLIGDKITTLGFKTIGLPENRRSDTIKHIYDIGTLLKLIENKTSTDKLSEIFLMITDYQNSFIDTKFSNESIISDIISSVNSLLVQGIGYSLESTHEGRYCTFKNQLLQKSNAYNKLNHVNDILLIKLLSSYLQLLIKDQITPKEVVERFYRDLMDFKQIILQNGSRKKQTRKEIILSYDTSTKGKFITTLSTAEQVFLFNRIENLLT